MPKPMGTEFKYAADGCHDLLLYLEIQEGKTAMRRARHFAMIKGGVVDGES
jgi:hypothetical protein